MTKPPMTSPSRLPASMSSSTERPSGAFRAELPAVALLRKLTQLSRAVAQAASLDEILQLAVKQASAILEAEQTLLMLVETSSRMTP